MGMMTTKLGPLLGRERGGGGEKEKLKKTGPGWALPGRKEKKKRKK
jgi:hypothetical protein